jgi:hypothetical protein
MPTVNNRGRLFWGLGLSARAGRGNGRKSTGRLLWGLVLQRRKVIRPQSDPLLMTAAYSLGSAASRSRPSRAAAT